MTAHRPPAPALALGALSADPLWRPATSPAWTSEPGASQGVALRAPGQRAPAVGLLDDSDLLVSEARLHGPTTVELLGAHMRCDAAPRDSTSLRHDEARRGTT
jgi:hypothetical protein